jgi:hypothetical protein
MRKKKEENRNVLTELVPMNNTEFKIAQNIAYRKDNYSKSQQQIIKQMKKQSELQWNMNLTESLQKAFSTTDEEGVSVYERLSARCVADLVNRENISVKEMIEIKQLLGENVVRTENKNLNVDIKAELSKLTGEEEF